MLGVKSNNEPIKGKFAKILREEIAAALKDRGLGSELDIVF